MNNYELTVLVKNEADMSVVKKLLETFEGKMEQETKWGKRELAYPINKETSAFYITWKISLDATKVADFKQKMNFDEKVMRYLMLKLN